MTITKCKYFLHLQEGFNAAGGASDHHRVRIGMIANNENNCHSADSRIGFGGGGRGCASHGKEEEARANSCGNVAQCRDADRGDTNYPVTGYIMAR